MNNAMQGGFLYTFEKLDRQGRVVWTEQIHNLIPIEGLNHFLNVALKGSTQIPTWYVGIYTNNYTPAAGDTMAAFPAAAGEITTYANATRHTLVLGTVASGAVDNTASKAEITFTSAASVQGGFITSVAAKGATTGVLLSAVKNASPKNFEVGETLRVSAGFTLISA